MENNMFGLKDIYDCTLKATYDMKVGNRVIKAGEPIVVFESLSLANFDEFKKHFAARGGYSNQTWVTWDSTSEVTLNFSQGIFSKTHLAILGNAYAADEETIKVPMRESKETDEKLQVQLKHEAQNIYVYRKDNGDLIEDFIRDKNILIFSNIEPYTDLEIFYDFDYINANVLYIGRQLIRGYVDLTAKTRLKDDMTGKTVTAIIHMPKVKLMSDFSIRLGNDAPPAVGRFSIIAYPVGSKGSEKVMEFISLNDDIDSDI